MQPQPAAAFGLCIWWVQGHAPCPEIMHKHFVLAWLGRPAGCWRCKTKRTVWFLAFLASTGALCHWAVCKDEHQHFPYLHIHLGKSFAAALMELKILQNNGAKGRRQTVPACHSKAWSQKGSSYSKTSGKMRSGVAVGYPSLASHPVACTYRWFFCSFIPRKAIRSTAA